MPKNSGLVYSTDRSVSVPKDKKGPRKKKYTPSEGPCHVRLEKKGRGGKQVTVLFDLPYEETEAKAIMKKLQDHFACGATFKDGTICLSGDFCEKVRGMIREKQI